MREKNNDFLRSVYEDMKEDLRCRRIFESQHIHYFFLFHAIVGVAIVSLFQAIENDCRAYLYASFSIAVFIVGITAVLIHRVVYDHGKYAEIGRIIQKIWDYYGMFTDGRYLEGDSLLPKKLYDPEKGYGTGKGYFYTCVLLGVTTAGMLFFMTVLVLIKMRSC